MLETSSVLARLTGTGKVSFEDARARRPRGHGGPRLRRVRGRAHGLAALRSGQRRAAQASCAPPATCWPARLMRSDELNDSAASAEADLTLLGVSCGEEPLPRVGMPDALPASRTSRGGAGGRLARRECATWASPRTVRRLARLQGGGSVLPQLDGSVPWRCGASRFPTFRCATRASTCPTAGTTCKGNGHAEHHQGTPASGLPHAELSPCARPTVSPRFAGLPSLTADLLQGLPEAAPVWPPAPRAPCVLRRLRRPGTRHGPLPVLPRLRIRRARSTRSPSPTSTDWPPSAREALIVRGPAAGEGVEPAGRPCRRGETQKRDLSMFSRSLKLREVSAGGCMACEADVNVLGTLVYDLGRFGIEYAASPRHADGILVTGPVTENMRQALLDTWEAVPEPKIVIAVGVCAISGGAFREQPGRVRRRGFRAAGRARWTSMCRAARPIPGPSSTAFSPRPGKSAWHGSERGARFRPPLSAGASAALRPGFDRNPASAFFASFCRGAPSFAARSRPLPRIPERDRPRMHALRLGPGRKTDCRAFSPVPPPFAPAVAFCNLRRLFAGSHSLAAPASRCALFRRGLTGPPLHALRPTSASAASFPRAFCSRPPLTSALFLPFCRVTRSR